MGGRGSLVKANIVELGTGEGLLMQDRQRLGRWGFVWGAYGIEELVSEVRYADDASCASFVFCEECMWQCLQEAWGPHRQVSVEEHGAN